MFLVLMIIALAAVAVVASVVALRTDGYRRTPIDPAKLRHLTR
ncbi:hypothetical protein [Microbacterium sp.]